MTTAFQAAKISDRVYWVGAIDWSIRNFHGYLTSRGTTYNAFLVRGEKTALIDTVKKPFWPEMLSRIGSVMDVGDIDYIVSNHAEMDHSGSLNEAVATAKPDKILASPMGVKVLAAHLKPDYEITAVADGERLDLGGATLSFLETKMLHWPDSMISYMPEEKMLFAQDAFGMHLATYERYADQLPSHVLDYEAAKYYANIVMPFAPIVRKTLKRIEDAGLEFDMICPDHGPIWRRPEDIAGIIGQYSGWAERTPSMRAVVVYDTMWSSTATMATAVGEGLAAGGATPIIMPLEGSHRSDVATEVLNSGALLIGSPTLNNNMYPTIADLLCYLSSLAPKELVGAAFGSYGWSGQAPGQVAKSLEEMKIELVGDPLRVNWVPGTEELTECRELGLAVANRMKERVG